MDGAGFTDRVARRLAAPSGRRAVLAAVVAGLTTTATVAAQGGCAAAAARRRRTPRHNCRKDGNCGFGEKCLERRCTPVTGFSAIGGPCRTTADCSIESGPLVCAFGPTCVCGGGGQAGGPDLCGPWWRCTGLYDEHTGAAARCLNSCECAEGLACVDSRCRPAPTG